ncbi:MAG: MurR/RpiR family transcriptional regulator [Chloroflexota bacterium]
MIEERIRQAYAGLTRSQKRIADFVSGSYREAAFMTAARMADRLGLNEATVIRFAQRLGYAGYPEMMGDLKALVRDELRAQPTAAPEATYATIIASEITSLQRLLSHVSPELAQRAVELICRAEAVHVMGYGLAASLAQLMSLHLRMLGFEACAPLADPLSVAVALDASNAATTVIALSFEQRCPELANALSLARERGAGTVALTRSPTSPCAQVADVSLSCPPSEGLPFPSITAVALLTDVLVQAVAAQRGPDARMRLARAYHMRDRVLAE